MLSNEGLNYALYSDTINWSLLVVLLPILMASLALNTVSNLKPFRTRKGYGAESWVRILRVCKTIIHYTSDRQL